MIRPSRDYEIAPNGIDGAPATGIRRGHTSQSVRGRKDRPIAEFARPAVDEGLQRLSGISFSPANAGTTSGIIVILNWAAGLKK